MYPRKGRSCSKRKKKSVFCQKNTDMKRTNKLGRCPILQMEYVVEEEQFLFQSLLSAKPLIKDTMVVALKHIWNLSENR